MQGRKGSLGMILIGAAAALLLGSAAGTVINAQPPAPEKSPVYRAKAARGRILDRYGSILAYSGEDGSRSYPEDLCPHIIGTLSASGEAQSGIELALDTVLRGQDGLRDSGHNIPVRDGSDVYLTIDSSLQRAAESILEKAAAQYRKGVDYDTAAPYCGKAGAIVILGCESGEVLACASYPDFPLNDFSRRYDSLAADDNSPLLCRALNGLYRPGSTFKPVTAAAALCSGAVRADTRFWCGSHLRLGDTDFSCVKPHGAADVRRALELSCNIYFYRAALLTGSSQLTNYARLFGFGQAPRIELPTVPGSFASPENTSPWSEGQLIQAAIGQSTTLCTPLQMAIEALTLAREGSYLEPTVIRSTGGMRPESEPVPNDELYSFGSKEVFDLIKRGMTDSTVYTYGEWALSKLPHPCAVKTGTPQSPRGYDSAVIGFYPADRPEIAFAVMLEGGANAKHTVFEICEAYNKRIQF